MGSVVAGNAAKKTAQQYGAMSAKQTEQALKMLEGVGIPSIEAQKLILEQPELVGQYVAEQAGPSEMAGVTTDPAFAKAQKDALSGLQERGEVGLTAEEMADFKNLSRNTAAQDQARQSSILQSMAARGALDSGASLAAQLSSSQQGARAAEEQSDRIAAQAAAARREALSQSGSLAGQLRSQEYGEKTDAARAIDQINQFNLQNRQSVADKNVGERQRIAEAQSATKNQQQQYNKQLLQQDYQNRMSKAQGMGNIKVGQAAQTQATGQSIGQGQLAMGQGFDQMATGIGSAVIASDERCKENIETPPVEDMLSKLEPSEYNYKTDPKKEKHVGVMAQDLEKSELGKEFVTEDKDGMKMVDYGKMAPFMLAALAHLSKKMKDKK